jgi:hypothetical protein
MTLKMTNNWRQLEASQHPPGLELEAQGIAKHNCAVRDSFKK